MGLAVSFLAVMCLFPASRGLSRRGKMKRQERDLCRLPTSFLSGMHSRFLNLVPRVSLLCLPWSRKTLVAAGHVPSCDTNFPIGVGSTNNFCRSQLKRKKGPSKFSSPVVLSERRRRLKFRLVVSFTQVR